MKIIVIGNGFDLSLGLKTSYKDFIESKNFDLLIEKENTLALYLEEKREINNWVDIEKELTNYSKQIKDDKKTVKDDFKELKNSLIDYLEEAQEKKINQNSKAFEMIKSEISDTDIIFNFNYTNSVFKIAEILGIPDIGSKHSYVHGSIENKDIIFGVEDYARINNDHIFFKKAYNPNFASSNIISIFQKEKLDLIIFGHSLGITDSSYFQSFFNSHVHVKNDSKIKIFYYGEEGYDEMMIILDEYTSSNLTNFKHNNKLEFIDSSI